MTVEELNSCMQACIDEVNEEFQHSLGKKANKKASEHLCFLFAERDGLENFTRAFRGKIESHTELGITP